MIPICGSYTIDIEISAKWSNKCFAWIIYFAILPVNCFEGVWIASFLILPLRGRMEFYDTYIQRCNSKMFKSAWFHLSVGKKDKNYHEKKKTLKLITNILFWLCFFFHCKEWLCNSLSVHKSVIHLKEMHLHIL